MLIERILFNVLALFMFVLVFGKMIQKNDGNYIVILIIQAFGIAISFFELIIGNMEWSIFKSISYFISIILPMIFLYLNKKNINALEKMYLLEAKIYIKTNNNSRAKKILINILNKYPDSYLGHKTLAQIYEKEGRNEKGN